MKELKYYTNLPQTARQSIDKIIELKDTNGKVSTLKNSIYSLDDKYIQQLLDDPSSSLPPEAYKVGELSDAQTLGVSFMILAKSMLLSDSVGLGKTVETAAYINYLKAEANKPFRYIIFTEVKAAKQVQRELIKFTGEYVDYVSGWATDINPWLKKHRDVNGNFIPFSGGLVVPHSITKNSNFFSYIGILAEQEPFDLFVIDEGSVIGNHTSDVSKAFYQYAKFADKRIVLNATPFERSLLVLYNQLYFVDKDVLPARSKFKEEYCVFDMTTKQYDIYKYKNNDNFKELTKYIYFGNTRSNLGAQIEDSTVKLLTAPLSPVQKKMYPRTNYYGLVNDCPTYLDDKIPFTVDTTPKLKLLEDVIKQIPKDEQVIIFSHFKMSHELLKDYLTTLGYTVASLNGETSKGESNEIIEAFKNNEFNILITNVQKSLNFGNCNYGIFYSLPTNPSKILQMEGRLTRSFDIKNKHFYILIMEGHEYNNLVNVTKKALENTQKFTYLDNSVIGSFLLHELKA